MPDAAAKTTALLKGLWQKNLPILQERMQVLSQAASGDLSPERKTQAAAVAHKLAGSLGMFGYPEGTTIAREVEVILNAPGAVDRERLQDLVTGLHEALPL